MRILLVEDAVEVSAAMVDLLATRDHSADVVTNVADAVSLIRSDEFDLIVLDLNLPGGSGKELLSYCKSNRIDVPIFVVSARADLEDRVGLLESGADDYLVKPFDPPEFLARVRALLRRPKEKAPARTLLGALTFDHDERRAFQHRTGLDHNLHRPSHQHRKRAATGGDTFATAEPPGDGGDVAENSCGRTGVGQGAPVDRRVIARTDEQAGRSRKGALGRIENKYPDAAPPAEHPGHIRCSRIARTRGGDINSVGACD